MNEWNRRVATPRVGTSEKEATSPGRRRDAPAHAGEDADALAGEKGFSEEGEDDEGRMRGGVANGRDGGDGGGGFVAATNMTFAGSPSSFGRGAPSSPNLSNLSSNSPFLSPPSPPPRTSASYSNGLSVKVEPLVERADSLSRIESLGLGTEIPLPPLGVSGGEREGAVSPGRFLTGHGRRAASVAAAAAAVGRVAFGAAGAAQRARGRRRRW